jgi:Fur family transcriptional regulator, zinc uptake regulator
MQTVNHSDPQPNKRAPDHHHDHGCPGCAEPDAAFSDHDHVHCATDVLSRADAMAAGRAVRLTPVRRRVLEILLEHHRAMGAYDVLNRLAQDGFGNQPPVAYRALEFLVEQGLAHRIQRLNGYLACMHPGEAHAPAFLICATCHAIAETSAEGARDALSAPAAGLGFQMDRLSVEVMGLCPTCQTSEAA